MKAEAVTPALEGALELIAHYIPEGNPFGNTGDIFENYLFKAHAYDWGDDDQPWNFKWRDLEVRWYKYLGRGMSANRWIGPEEIWEMLNEIIPSLLKETNK